MAIGCFEVLLSGRGYLDITRPLEPVSLSFICAVFLFHICSSNCSVQSLFKRDGFWVTAPRV